jgi:hypothetical protein
MRKAVLAAAGLVILAAVSWTAAPAQAMAISAPAALKGASDNIKLTEPVCWNCGWGPGYGYYRPYYRPWFRPYYRLAYYGYGGPYYRPYYRPYWGGYYRPYRPYWGGYGYYAPRPRFYSGPRVYWY